MTVVLGGVEIGATAIPTAPIAVYLATVCNFHLWEKSVSKKKRRF